MEGEDEKYKKEDWLRDNYVKQDKTRKQVAKECGVSEWKIKTWLSKLDVTKVDTNQGRTHEEYCDKLNGIHGGKIEPLEEYINCRKSIKHKCNECSYVWRVTPDSLLQGRGCPKCAGNIKKTHDEYIKEVKGIHGQDVIVLGKYQGAHTKIKHKCGFCDYVWMVLPSNILKGRRCPKCFGHNEPTQKEYEEKVDNVHGARVEVLEDYKTARDKIKHKCGECGKEWMARPDAILSGQRCPACAMLHAWDGRRKTTDGYKEEVRNVHDGDIKVLDEYKGSEKRIKHRCQKCAHVWKALPSRILQDHGCPHCHQSVGEERVENYLEKKNINYDTEVTFDRCKDKGCLPFDFGIYSDDGDLLSLVEHDGKLHYAPVGYFGGEKSFKKRVMNDHIKDQYALSNNIPLLRLNYMDRDNNNIESKLKSFLNDIGTINV